MATASPGHGDEPATSGGRSHAGLNVALCVVALLLACAGVVGGVDVYRTHGERADAAVEQARYGDVLAAATKEAEAVINLDYRHPRDSMATVAAGATGKFRRQYDTSSAGVTKVLLRNRSVMDGKVVSAGVVDLHGDSATVIAATSGTVANARTHNKQVARSFRLRLHLVYTGGRWLTSDLEFVG